VKKFVALFDLHYGYERRSGHKIPLHDEAAIDATLQFVSDFKPDTIIIGGDGLDCGAISHHNHDKPGKTEELRLYDDGELFRTNVLSELEKTRANLVYIEGNHEDWINDFTDATPGIKRLISLRTILSLDDRWNIIDQGGYFNLGKLTFVHGDQFSGGEYVAKAAVIAYERNIRFGHFHTYQAYTKTSAIDINIGRTGVAVPCLCRKNPRYGESKPNRWVQGFNYGYVSGNGNFNDYFPIIVNGSFMAEGKQYGKK
jgi:metallophosphoesterase superfamily enzyme